MYVRKPPQICLNSPGFPFRLYIIFSFGMHDANSFVNLADAGGCSFTNALQAEFVFIDFYQRCISQGYS